MFLRIPKYNNTLSVWMNTEMSVSLMIAAHNQHSTVNTVINPEYIYELCYIFWENLVNSKEMSLGIDW